jgi:hypothetical protein
MQPIEEEAVFLPEKGLALRNHHLNDHMSKFRAFSKPEGLSLLILVLPYLAFLIPVFAGSPFFSLPKLLLTLVVVVIIDILVRMFLKKHPGATLWVSLLVYCGVFLFLYSAYLLMPSMFFVQKHFHSFHIRGRLLFLLLSVLIIAVVLISHKKKIALNYFVNMFMLILFVINLCTNTIELLQKKKYQATPSQYDASIHFDTKDSLSNKPIILIITDEYSSPDELYNLFRDSSLYDFSRELTRTGWVVRNRSLSHETSTIHSLSSLFNFNLSDGGQYSKATIFDASLNLLHCKLGDSLEGKNIGIVNFGILDFYRSEPLGRLYPYPKNFHEALLYNSAVTLIYQNTESMKPAGFGEDFNAIANHNKKVLETLPDSLQRLKSNDYFIYAHLLMPHLPYVYFDEFSQPSGTPGYLAYWKFTNKKVQQLLNELLQSHQYRIILTGDHGDRDDPKINPNYTATAFYGFEEKDVEKIRSVQDLGVLINAYFK